MTGEKITKDRVFKTIFVDEKRPFLLETLINDIIKSKIRIVAFLDKELPIENISEKVKIVDVLAECENQLIHIEVNTSYKNYTRWRNYVYLSKIIAQKVKVTEDYETKQKYISINLTRGLLESKELIAKYKVQNEKEVYLDNVEIYEVNVDKAKKLWKEEKEDESIKHIAALLMTSKEIKEVKKGDKYMEELSEKIEKLKAEDYWFTPEEDYKFILNTERLEGQEEIKKQIALKMIEEKEEIAKIIKYTGLSKLEIKKLQEKK